MENNHCDQPCLHVSFGDAYKCFCKCHKQTQPWQKEFDEFFRALETSITLDWESTGGGNAKEILKRFIQTTIDQVRKEERGSIHVAMHNNAKIVRQDERKMITGELEKMKTNGKYIMEDEEKAYISAVTDAITIINQQ